MVVQDVPELLEIPPEIAALTPDGWVALAVESPLGIVFRVEYLPGKPCRVLLTNHPAAHGVALDLLDEGHLPGVDVILSPLEFKALRCTMDVGYVEEQMAAMGKGDCFTDGPEKGQPKGRGALLRAKRMIGLTLEVKRLVSRCRVFFGGTRTEAEAALLGEIGPPPTFDELVRAMNGERPATVRAQGRRG